MKSESAAGADYECLDYTAEACAALGVHFRPSPSDEWIDIWLSSRRRA